MCIGTYYLYLINNCLYNMYDKTIFKEKNAHRSQTLNRYVTCIPM